VSPFVLAEKYRKLALFAAAAVLSALAYRVSSNEARIDWLRANRPNETVWALLLEARRFVEVQDPRAIESLGPSLPYLRSGRDPRVWITEDSRVLVRFEPEGTRLFTLGRGIPERILPGTWEPLGMGWDAFQSLQNRTIPIPVPPARGRKKIAKSASYHDPRALSY